MSAGIRFLDCALHHIARSVLRVGLLARYCLRRGDLGLLDRAMLALYDFYPSKEDLLGEAMAGWALVAAFLLLIALV